MRTIHPLLFTLLIALLIGACSDDTTVVTAPKVAPAGAMIALLNGASFTSESGAATSAEYIRTSRLLTIFGTKGGNEELSLSVYTLNGTGTYSLGGPQAQGVAGYAYFNSADSTQTRTYSTSSAKSGTITISKFDTVGLMVSGTFKFDAIQLSPPGTTNTMRVLDGSFTDLPLTMRDSSATRSTWSTE
jgi:hypothetical protein